MGFSTEQMGGPSQESIKTRSPEPFGSLRHSGAAHKPSTVYHQPCFWYPGIEMRRRSEPQIPNAPAIDITRAGLGMLGLSPQRSPSPQSNDGVLECIDIAQKQSHHPGSPLRRARGSNGGTQTQAVWTSISQVRPRDPECRGSTGSAMFPACHPALDNPEATPIPIEQAVAHVTGRPKASRVRVERRCRRERNSAIPSSVPNSKVLGQCRTGVNQRTHQ